MASEIKLCVPKVDLIPDGFFVNNDYEEAFKLLGFKYFDSKYTRIYTNGIESMHVIIMQGMFQWIFMIPYVIINSRSIAEPTEFSIQEELAPIEILTVLFREWKNIFKRAVIPKDLYFGYLYSEHIKNLKSSRPPKPLIVVERDYLRFTISKIKKQFNPDQNENLNISLTGDQLTLGIGSRKYPIPVMYHENFTNEIVSVPLIDFLTSIPSRFQKDEVSLSMDEHRLRVDNHLIDATWDGPNLWEYDEYDDYLFKRLMHRSIWFGG